MRRHYSLTALRAFEAVARLKSISAAAQELHVTRPAVSKQVTLLEADIGRSLLLRIGNTIELTPAGSELFSGLRQGLEIIYSTTEAVSRRAPDERHIRVLVCRDFASSWLAGQIGTFLVANPGISVEITAERNGAFRQDEDFDFRIFYANEGALASKAFHESVLCRWIDMLVCTPDFAANHLGPEKPLCEAPYLADANYDMFEEWCSLTGINAGGTRQHITVFNETTLCLSVAASGGGLTIGDSFLALPPIQSGSFVVPYKVGLVSAQCYLLFKRRNRPPTVAHRKFETWLRGAIRDYQSSLLQVLADKGIRIIERAGLPTHEHAP